jgi:hypothetical protein
MSTHARGEQRPRLRIPAWARLLAAGIGLVGLLATGLALTGVLPARQAPDAARVAQPAKIDFGLPSRTGLDRVGAAPGSFPVTLELGLLADQKGIASAARASSDPSSSTYGIYPTLSEFARRRGADSARQRAVIDTLSAVGIRGAVDATGLRVTLRPRSAEWSSCSRDSGRCTQRARPEPSSRCPTGSHGSRKDCEETSTWWQGRALSSVSDRD